jgi:hypothetical protein
MFVGIGIAVLLIGASGFGLSQVFGDRRTAATAAEFAALRGELRAMNSRLATMEAASGAKPDTGLDDLATRIQAIESRLAPLETQITDAADRNTLNLLSDRLARLEREGEGAALHRAAALLAAANLARAAEQAGPFRTELEALRAAEPDNPALKSLEATADTGVPTRVTLNAQFPGVARAALDAEREQGASRNFFSSVWTGFRRLIRVRRVGAVEGNTLQDHLARAQIDSDRGDLGTAAMEVQAISGPTAIPLKSWLKDAHARLDMDSTIIEMNARIVRTLAAPATLSVAP